MAHFGEKGIKQTIFAIFILLLVSLTSCDYMPRECLSQLESPFRMTVEGEIDGEGVEAEIFCDPTEHRTKEIYDKLTVTFLAPMSLEGITVTLRSDDKATIRLKNSEETLPLYSGFTEPFASLWQTSEPHSVTKTAEGYEIEFREENFALKYFFDRDGKLRSLVGVAGGRNIALNVTKFEQMEK